MTPVDISEYQPSWYVTYRRPGGERARLGPMNEDYARSMVKEYARKGLKEVRLEEWGPVRAWKLTN